MAEDTFFRHISGEESQNDFFVSLLSFSLEHGPAVLNAMHNNLEFTEAATVVATQRDRLPRTPREDDTGWILDWVVEDTDKLVGYESKKGSAVPSKAQLDGELRKLRANSGGRDVHLYAITDHSNNPLERSDVEWLSWHDIADRVQSLNIDTDSIRMLQQMFENQGYDSFDGFDTFEQTRAWFAKHDGQVVDLAFSVDRHLEAIELYTTHRNNLPHHTTTAKLPLANRKRSLTINQAIYTLPFHPRGEPEFVENMYHQTLMVPAIRNEAFVAHHIHTTKSDNTRPFVRNNAERIATIVEENDMILRTSWNRLNHPERGIQEYTDPEAVKEVLQNKTGSKYWKRLYFGWEIDTDQDAKTIVEEIGEKLTDLDRLFHDPADGLDEIPV